VYKLDWRNWWESAGDELADFVGNTYNRPIISKTIQAVNGRGNSVSGLTGLIGEGFISDPRSGERTFNR